MLPGSGLAANALGLDPNEPGDRLYRFEALEIKELSHRLDGVLWPKESTGFGETGSPELPVVLLEVQMHPDPGFHPRVEHWAVVVITPHSRLNLLTLPIRPERDLAASSQQILASRPDLDAVVLPMLMQRFPEFSREDIMVIAGIPHEELRHTRAAQEWLAEGRQEGRQEGEAKVTLRLLNRRCGPLSETTAA